MACCLSSPLAWLLHLCGLASGPLLFSLSFNSSLPIPTWSIPNPTSSKKWPCFQTPPAHSLPCTWCLLGSGALLTPWSLTSASRDCLTCTKECREKHPALGPAACSQKQSLGLLPRGPPLLMTRAAHLNVHHYCGHVLHPCLILGLCLTCFHFLQTALQVEGTGMGCEGGGLCTNAVLSFFSNSMTTVVVILILIIGFGVSGM